MTASTSTAPTRSAQQFTASAFPTTSPMSSCAASPSTQTTFSTSILSISFSPTNYAIHGPHNGRDFAHYLHGRRTIWCHPFYRNHCKRTMSISPVARGPHSTMDASFDTPQYDVRTWAKLLTPAARWDPILYTPHTKKAMFIGRRAAICPSRQAICPYVVAFIFLCVLACLSLRDWEVLPRARHDTSIALSNHPTLPLARLSRATHV
ncbi:hypothetical protein BD769DRAFT_1663360 [Suillus cothurnatus]|nr:hypothetical protein BD769DRAFT_1663360 [Suillus cothurnatus]